MKVTFVSLGSPIQKNPFGGGKTFLHITPADEIAMEIVPLPPPMAGNALLCEDDKGNKILIFESNIRFLEFDPASLKGKAPAAPATKSKKE